MRTSRGLVLGLTMACTACATARMPVTAREAARVDRPVLLPVPYVSQSVLLCGGAAIAMIERWWGRRGVFAEDFSSLVHPEAGGILTTDMTQTMRARGWEAEAINSTTAALVQQSVADGVPVVALIRVARNRYHYVVIVGWNAEVVSYHDPAVAPAVRVAVSDFMRRWAGANQWAMFVRPSAAVATIPVSPLTHLPSPTVDSLPCRPWLDRAADAASENRLEDADHLLAAAVMECPSEPLVLRELAGVRFRQGKQVEAARLAAEYARRAPNDSLGWQLLASSRYLADDFHGALQAWNAIGRPTIDLLRIDGTQHIRFRPLASSIGTAPGSVLTPPRFALAQRRLADIPSLAVSKVTYTAVTGGVVEVRAVVIERPFVDPLPQLLVVSVVRAVTRRDATLALSTPFGAGEQWTAQWRWESADPRVVLRLEMPARIGIPGIVSIARSWETFRYTAGTADESRRASSLTFAGWTRPDIEQQGGVRLERWSGQGSFLAFSLGGGAHRAHDRFNVLVQAEHAIPLSGTVSYDRARTRAEFTLPTDRWLTSWSMHAGADWNSSGTPRGLWSIAGGNLSRDIPLRAHPFIVDGRLPSSRAARAIMHGGVAGDRPVASIGRVAIGVGIFVDGANVLSHRSQALTERLYLDGGAGLRIGLKEARWAALRVDVARGLTADRRWGVSVGIEQTRLVRLGRLH